MGVDFGRTEPVFHQISDQVCNLGLSHQHAAKDGFGILPELRRQTYARQNDVKVVRPFMLVVTQDTNHARQVKEFVESDGFFGGRYKGRVAEIHSKLRGEESDENAQRLLNIEKSGDTDIVIHVNKLKEGWDVSNLFTIVPLRASASDILTEQTLGRGLRLPYGKRTGVEVVDTLTVIAHERFNELIEKAKEENGVTRKLKQVTIGEGGDVAPTKPVTVPVPSIIDQMLSQAEAKTKPTVTVTEDETGETWVQPAPQTGGMSEAPKPFTFSTPEEVKVARTVLDQVLPQVSKQVRSIKDLNDPKIVEQIADTAMKVAAQDADLFSSVTREQAVAVATELCKNFVDRTFAIPALTITPQQQVSFGFRRFDLDMKAWNFQPLSRELFVQVLRTEKTSIISGEEEGETASRLEDYIVARLIDYPEIDYDTHAEILYDLAGQAVAHTRARFPEDEDQALSVVRGHAKTMAESIFSQMKQNMWREQTNYRVSLSSAFGELRPQTFDTAGTGFIRDFHTPPDQKQDIRKYVFTGFARGCYQYAKFDSDPERKLAVVLEKEPTVRLWMKPGPNQFKIFDANGAPYQPDFVVETDTAKLIIEVKRLSEMKAPEVLRKADAASLWCHVATKACAAHGEKPWTYLLVPETDVQENFTVAGLIAKHTRAPDGDLLARYQIDEAEVGAVDS